MPAKVRDPRWDNIKFFLIYLVILGHIMETFCDTSGFARSTFIFIYTFHMPAFLFISGLFGKHTIENDHYNVKKLLPYLLVCFFLNFYRAFSLWVLNPDHKFHFDDQNNISWFLMALFACYTIAWILRKWNPRYVLTFAVLIALIAGYDTHIDETFAISRILTFFPFFYAGYLTDRRKLEEFLDRRSTKTWSAVLLALYFVLCIVLCRYFYAFRPLATGQNSYDELPLGMQPYSFLFRAVYYCGSFLMMMCFFSLMPKGHLRGISTYGQRTLAVYFWHLPLVTWVCRTNFIQQCGHHLWFVILFPLVYGAILLLLFSQKPFSVPLDKMMRPDSWHTGKTVPRH